MLSQQFNQLLYDYRAVLFLILCLMGQLIGWRLWLRRAKHKEARLLVHLVFIVFNLAWVSTVILLYAGGNIMTDFFWTWIGRPGVSWQLAYILAILPLGALATLVLGLISRLGRFKRSQRTAQAEESNNSDEPVDESRRDLIKAAGTAGLLGILGTSAYGVVRQGRPPQVARLSIGFDDLPRELDGFKIAHLTDVHLGLWASQRELDQALALIAAEEPHLAALTGDLVDRNPEFAKLYREPLERLSGLPHGVWGVLGNHDHYAGPLRIAELLDGHGLTMLVDRQVNLPGLPLSLIGLDDQGIHHSWMGSGPPSVDKEDLDVLKLEDLKGPAPRPGDFIILLNHRPEGFRQAARHGCRLYLAGHTHGGQYQIPRHDQINLAAAFYKYSSGLYQDHGAFINVSRGLAAVGIPFRLWAWPEISLITLRRGSSA